MENVVTGDVFTAVKVFNVINKSMVIINWATMTSVSILLLSIL